MIRNRIQGHYLGLAFVFAFGLGCDYQVYATEVGEHVIYHWDADAPAVEDRQLCGGTVQAADRFVAGIADYYGWSLGGDGPTIEYFWDRKIIKNACSWLGSNACMLAVLMPQVFTYKPFDSHELAHTAKGGHGHYPFIDEAFAARWQSGVIGREFTIYSTPTFFSADELRAQFERDATEIDTWRAFTWWIALESTYGPAKMGEFIVELGSPQSDIERALQRTFGISLAESAALAEALASEEEATIDDPVCAFAELPSLVWNGEPLVIDRGEARCEDDDIIAIEGPRATWLVELEFPESPVDVEIHVTISEGDPTQKELVVASCKGGLTYDPVSYASLGAWGPAEPGALWSLGGRHVASLIGVLEPDGAVLFPRAVIEEVSP